MHQVYSAAGNAIDARRLCSRAGKTPTCVQRQDAGAGALTAKMHLSGRGATRAAAHQTPSESTRTVRSAPRIPSHVLGIAAGRATAHAKLSQSDAQARQAS